MTKATISIKRKSGIFDQLWYVNSDGHPDNLGKDIFDNLKTVDDVERATIVFRNAKSDSRLETNFILGEVKSIKSILKQYNDYSYVLDEETGKWGFYEYECDELHDLEEELRTIEVKRLPWWITDFAYLRENGIRYADKTALIHQMITSGQGAVLYRPKFFGKSLLCSTLQALFEGRRELFAEIAGRPALAINSLEWEWRKHSVIKLDLKLQCGNYFGVEGFQAMLYTKLKDEQNRHGIALTRENLADMFADTIRVIHNKTGEQVVVIIDGCDQPLLGTINEPVHTQIKNELLAFYNVLKICNDCLRFVFFTDIAKVLKIETDMNYLTDITFDPHYATLCGMAQDEVETYFGLEIEDVLESTEKTQEEYLEELHRFCGGYRFSEKPVTVYNFPSIFYNIDCGKKFMPYLDEFKMLSHAKRLITTRIIRISDFIGTKATYQDLSTYKTGKINALPLLYQAGFLTIVDYDSKSNQFTLGYPNDEIRIVLDKILRR